MTTEQLIADVRQRGIILEADGSQIKCKAPAGAITPDLVEHIRKHKVEILEFLSVGRKPERCLGVLCNAVRYQDVEGHLCLWCSHLNRGVINLMACPFDAWQKDEWGYPLPEKAI